MRRPMAQKTRMCSPWTDWLRLPIGKAALRPSGCAWRLLALLLLAQHVAFVGGGVDVYIGAARQALGGVVVDE